jgi:3-methyladenine DNA glycosylase AlkC
MPFADELIGPAVAETLSRTIRQVTPGGAAPQLQSAVSALQGLSVRERADLLRDALFADVGDDYAGLAATVRRARDQAPEFTGWLIWPVTSAVAVAAARDGSADAFTDAMALLAELTGRLTAEFALRTLLRHDLDRALPIILEWTASDDEHVRRLASEGTRLYLPWSIRVPELAKDPSRTIPILDALHRDESEYVRRSVANHLNDLSRESPTLVVQTARRWLESPAPTTLAVVRHAMRTLVKRGDADALALLGFGPADVDISGPYVEPIDVAWGGSVRFTATVRNTGAEPSRLAIDYVVHHLKANGSLSEKVFKLTTCDLSPGDQLEIDRTHSFRPITTRRYHPGGHAVSLQVNGVATHPALFEFLPPVADQ